MALFVAQIPSYRGRMRLASIGLAGLAAFLAGAISGSRTHAPAPFDPHEPVVHVDTFRRLDPGDGRARRSDDGVWTLPTQQIEARPVPFEELTPRQVHQMLERYPEFLGPASIGKPNGGSLLNGVQLPESPRWRIQLRDHAFGTPALVTCLQRSIDTVHAQFPGSRALDIGDLSREDGGYLRGHRSHQSGLDADIGFYYQQALPWYTKATKRNLDVARTWALVRALVTDCDLEYLFVDMRIQALLRDHAEQVGEDPEWLDALFSKGRNKPGIIRHIWGHESHIHLRVFDDRAQTIGERVHLAKMWARGGTAPR